MSSLSWSDRKISRNHWKDVLFIVMVLSFVFYRNFDTHYGRQSFGSAMALLAALLVLSVCWFLFPRHLRNYLIPYLILQGILIQMLSLLKPYDDTWALLYYILGLQILNSCSLRSTILLSSAIGVCILGGMIYSFGLVSGLGRAATYITSMLLILSYDAVSVLTETGRQESQKLLEELQKAHQRLKEYAIQAEELAAIKERNRLAHELHDSVGQMIFGISLNTETARLLLRKDPEKLPEQLESLQELTSGALGKMRSLIGQWRVG